MAKEKDDQDDEDDEDEKEPESTRDLVTCPNPTDNQNCHGQFQRPATYKGKRPPLCRSCYDLEKERRGQAGGSQGKTQGKKTEKGVVAALGALGAGALAGGKPGLWSVLGDALESYGSRRVGGMLSRSVPDKVIRSMRHIPFPEMAAGSIPVVTAAASYALGLSPRAREIVVDGVADFAGGLRERINGGTSDEEIAEQSRELGVKRRKLLEMEAFTFVYTDASDGLIHHPKCVRLPTPRKARRGKTGVQNEMRHLHLTWSEAKLQRLNYKQPSPDDPNQVIWPCGCGPMIEAHLRQLDDLRKEIKELEKELEE